jgi:D-beta-D-heptose 7-phosphate kinase/D-beta-D-heptose 1-phosphate adenosyltransferase
VVPARDRAQVLAALASVDDVIIFSEHTPEQVLRQVQPDIYVKGGDYRVEDVPEAEVVREWGGRTVILPYIDGRSTTNIIVSIANGVSAR